ncbi:alginate export family protein [Sinimarinibacterium sp. CAU 1509]|uniref:alginate export family protein n=1 Tax=Sinimarinibacterium sp. CAU 1509 TaxID=2562283 RepID=UPI001469EBFE|nr:alginate export family protein [Sinimarinibacterium sp. CAU 1509]
MLGGAGLLTCAAAAWGEETQVQDFLHGGTTQLDLRLRYESVEQDNLDKEANALTLRTRLGYSTRAVADVTAFVEFEHTAALVDDYAPETAGRPVVADPEGSELNRYGVQYAVTPEILLSAGRQRLIYDNARWIGNVGWRQNEQTFDGVFLHAGMFKTVTIDAAYLSTVNTITLSNVEVRAELLRVHWAIDPKIGLSAYGYWIDNEDPAAADLDTFGLRATGKVGLAPATQLRYSAEMAEQRAVRGSDRFDTRYGLAELALERNPLALKLGYELLGSDAGDFALQTPLGTRHAFQGWADVFLKTPDAGLRDAYVAVDAKLPWCGIGAAYHQFRSDESHDDLGRELDARISVSLPYDVQGQIKLARYRANDYGVDTDKLWLQIEYHL